MAEVVVTVRVLVESRPERRPPTMIEIAWCIVLVMFVTVPLLQWAMDSGPIRPPAPWSPL